MVRCSGISEARADGHEEFESEFESESTSEREKKGGGSTIGRILQRAFRGSECADPFGNSIRAPVQLLIVVVSLPNTYYYSNSFGRMTRTPASARVTKPGPNPHLQLEVHLPHRLRSGAVCV